MPTSKYFAISSSSGFVGTAKSQCANAPFASLPIYSAPYARSRAGVSCSGSKLTQTQMRFCVERRIRGQVMIDHGKVVRNQGAEVGQRTARVNECQQQRFSAELIEMNRTSVLVAQFEIGNRVAGRGHMVEDWRLVIGLGLRDHDDMI